MSEAEFRLPDVGEGLTEAEIVAWKVAPGDTVSVNQVIVEIETAKSLVELPSPLAGVVGALLVGEGDTVDVGTPIITVQSSGASAPSSAPAPGPSAAANAPAATSPSRDGAATSPSRDGAATPPSRDGAATQAAPGAGDEFRERAWDDEEIARPAPEDEPTRPASAERPDDPGQEARDESESVSRETEERSGSVLVGYGSAGGAASRRKNLSPSAPDPGERAERARRVAARRSFSPARASTPVIAKPPIRKLAKDLGVELSAVTGTGAAGEVTRDDVIREASQASVFRNIETPEWPEIREDRIPVKGVRKAIASAMVSSAFTAPHVSVFVDVDATRTMEFVKRLKGSTDFAGVKVSPLLIMAKAIIWAVRRNPMVNSTWTDDEIIVHHFVNLGVAAATPRGLIVPNVKEVQAMSLLELAEALEKLTLTARDGKTSPADMSGGTITLTNIGVFGMDTGTPILNPGEVAIIALGTIKQKAWVVDGEVRPRFVTTVGASFDHRVVDGDVASRFLADVASILEEPALLLE